MNFLSGGLNFFSALKQFDRNGDGKITEDDFIQVAHNMGFGSLGDSAIRGAFRQFDTNRNGTLEISEALQVIERLQSLSGGGSHGGNSQGGFGGFF